MDTPNWRQILGGTAGIALLGTIGYFGQARIQTGSSPTKFVSSKFKKAPPAESNNAHGPLSNIPEGDFNVPDALKKFKVDVSGEVVKLADFGASQSMTELNTESCWALKGTPFFMAPEVLQRQVSSAGYSEDHGSVTALHELVA